MEKNENQRSVSNKNKNFQSANFSSLKSENLSKKISTLITNSARYQIPNVTVKKDRIIYLKSRSQSNFKDQKLHEYEKYLHTIEQFNQKLSLTLREKLFKNIPNSLNMIQNKRHYLSNFQTKIANPNREMEIKQSQKLNSSQGFEDKGKERGNVNKEDVIILPQIEVTKEHLNNKVNQETTQERESLDDENINTYVKKNFTIVPDLTVPLNIKCSTLEKRNKLLEGFLKHP